MTMIKKETQLSTMHFANQKSLETLCYSHKIRKTWNHQKKKQIGKFSKEKMKKKSRIFRDMKIENKFHKKSDFRQISCIYSVHIWTWWDLN